MKLFEEDDEDTLYLKLVNNLAKLTLKERTGPGGDSESFLQKPASDYQKRWHLQSSEDKTLPGLLVFQAIASKYPDYGSVEELIKRWRKIQDEKTGSNLVANIDGIEAGAVSSERALHSFKSLLCKRCFMYDCSLHNDPIVDASLRLPGREGQEEEIPSGPCGDQCFLNLPSVRAVMTPRSLNISTKVSQHASIALLSSSCLPFSRVPVPTSRNSPRRPAGNCWAVITPRISCLSGLTAR